MRRARSVTGPLRRAHPASGATWNVQVVRGKMSSQCLWHACRALSAGLLLMLLGAAMAVIVPRKSPPWLCSVQPAGQLRPPSASQCVEAAQHRQAAHAGGKHREFSQGDTVLVRNYSKVGEEWTKGAVAERTGSVTYTVRTGKEGRDMSTEHADQIIANKISKRYSWAAGVGSEPPDSGQVSTPVKTTPVSSPRATGAAPAPVHSEEVGSPTATPPTHHEPMVQSANTYVHEPPFTYKPGYYADTLSVAEEVRGNSTISVKDEARGFHLNNLSYAGPIVMGFGGFIVVAACVMTFEARDSAAKVTPARPQTLPRPLPRRGPCAAPARLDQLGVYRLPHVLPLPHALPLAPTHRIRPPHTCLRIGAEKTKERARFGSAPDLRSGSARAPLPISALRRPLRRYALSVDEPPHSAVSASAAESECGSQSSLALDLHASGACAGVTLRVRDNTRRRPLARQQRLVEDMPHMQPAADESVCNVNNVEEPTPKSNEEEPSNETVEMVHLTVEKEARARSAPPATLCSTPTSPQLVISPPHTPAKLQVTSIVIEPSENDIVVGPPPPDE